MIYTGIMLKRDSYAIQRNTIQLLVVTEQQYCTNPTYANYSKLLCLFVALKSLQRELLVVEGISY